MARQSDSLDITFTSIDGSGGILAQAYLPDDVNRGRLAGDIEFDLAIHIIDKNTVVATGVTIDSHSLG